MAKFELRDYQAEAVKQGLHHFQKYDNPFVLVLPTGSGKSLVISDLCHKLDEPVLILQPSKEILRQNFQKLASYRILDMGIYSASFKSKSIDKYTFATIGSIYKKPELFRKFKHVIIDECHLVNPKKLKGMYNQFFNYLDIKNICGLTASPYRMVMKTFHMNDGLYTSASISTINRIHPFFFKKFAYQISIQKLLEMGYLSPLEYHYYHDFDVSNIKMNTTGADYDERALELFWNDERLKRLAAIIGEADSLCKHNLIFCSTINQAKKCTEMARAMGLKANYITGTTPAKERDRLIREFTKGNIKHMFNVGVLTTGFDFPALDGIILARPTLSLALLYQMVGRGLRVDPANPDKRCKVFDITENIKKMGRIETIRIDKDSTGYRDIVCTERGEITGKPLMFFKIKDIEPKKEVAQI